MKIRVALFALGLLLAIGVAVGQDAAAQQTDQTFDQVFVDAAAQGDMYEINSSQLAVDNATNEEVRAFAQRMIEDHTATTERLTAIAQEMAAQDGGVEMPGGMNPVYQLKLMYLSQQQDAAFDMAYVQQQVLAHQVAVSLFEMAAETVENEALRAFATESLPALQEHLQMAQDLMQQVGGQAQ